MKKLFCFCLLLWGLSFGFSVAEPLTPKQLKDQPYQYDSLPVMVKGKVGKLESLELKRGGAPPLRLTLLEIKGENDESIYAAMLGNSKAKPGSEIVFSGIFYAGVQLPGCKFENIVVEGAQSCVYLKKMLSSETLEDTPQASTAAPAKEIVILTPEQLLAAPDLYDRKSVLVKGDVRQLQENVAVGKYSFKKFSLEGASKTGLNGLAAATLMVNNGESIIGAGTFYKDYRVEGASEGLPNTLELAAVKTLDEIKALAAAEEARAAEKTGKKTGKPAKNEEKAKSGKTEEKGQPEEKTGKPELKPQEKPKPSGPPLPSADRIEGIIALGKVVKVDSVLMMGSPLPLIEIRINEFEPLKVLALDKTSPVPGAEVRLLGSFYRKFTMTKPPLEDVLAASRVEVMQPKDFKNAMIAGSFLKTAGTVTEVKTVDYQGKKALYLMLETRNNQDYPLFFNTPVELAAGERIRVMGKLQPLDSYVKNPPPLKRSGNFPAGWGKGLNPQYVLVVEWTEIIK